MKVNTTKQFLRLPIGKVCMVYFHSIDFVLGRTGQVRKAWEARCHLPKIMFNTKKGRKRRVTAASKRLHDYGLIKRMLAVKKAVYDGHKRMLFYYDKYCEEAEVDKYWGEEEDHEGDDMLAEVMSAEETNEADCDDEF